MSQSNQFSWQKRFQYQFDNFMSQGGLAVFLALLSGFFAAFVLMAGIRYFAELIFPNDYIDNYYDLSWEVFVQLIGLRDTGDEANFVAKFVGVITIFIGLIFFSSLVAFITEEFESRLKLLRKGKSIVVEENHTLILGFNDRIIDILKELIIANESEDYAAVVILSGEDKEEMDDFLRNNIPNTYSTRLITRNGSISNVANLNKVGLQSARSVIILNDAKSSDLAESKNLSDAKVIKSILTVLAAKEKGDIPAIAVELHLEQYRKLAESILPGVLTTLNEADILARILVQTSRNLGLSAVYLNLVGFAGNEFYFYRPEIGWGNLAFGELPFHFPDSMPLGIRNRRGEIKLNPSKDYLLDEDDEVVIQAEDDSTIKFEPRSHFDFTTSNSFNREKITLARKPEKHLIIGWNEKTAIALQEYTQYLLEGSQINLAVEHVNADIKEQFHQISDSNESVAMEVIEIDLNSPSQLAKLQLHQYHSISLLSGTGKNAEEIDAKTLTILLEIQQIFKQYAQHTGEAVSTELIAEIINTEDTDLVIKAGVKDFLLSNQLVSKILAQVSQEPDVMSIYQDLFSAEGSELYIKPISLYFPEEKLADVTFADCVLAAQSRDELCIGVKIKAEANNKAQMFGIKLIPSLEQKFMLSSEDTLIVLAEDES